MKIKDETWLQIYYEDNNYGRGYNDNMVHIRIEMG